VVPLEDFSPKERVILVDLEEELFLPKIIDRPKEIRLKYQVEVKREKEETLGLTRN
jgi:hypothetical protein